LAELNSLTLLTDKMGLLNKIFGRKDFDKRLQGIWTSDLNDEATKQSIGDVTITFTEDGKLIYDTHETDKTQRINMIYWTSGDTIYTDQPSSPRQDKTQYSFPDKDQLVLAFSGQLTKYKKKN